MTRSRWQAQNNLKGIFRNFRFFVSQCFFRAFFATSQLLCLYIMASNFCVFIGFLCVGMGVFFCVYMSFLFFFFLIIFSHPGLYAFVLYYYDLIHFYSIDAYLFLRRDRKVVHAYERQSRWTDSQRSWGRGNVIRIYCMWKIYFH